MTQDNRGEKVEAVEENTTAGSPPVENAEELPGGLKAAEAQDGLPVASEAQAQTKPKVPEYDLLAEFERLKEDWPEYAEEELALVAELGPEAVKGWENGAKYRSINFGKGKSASEAADPMVALRNVGDSDVVVKSQRYELEHEEVIKDKDGKEKKLAHAAGAPVRADELAKHGMTQLNLKGKTESRPAGTYLVCKASLARVIKEHAGAGDNLQIEKFDPEVHVQKARNAITLTKDPSTAGIKTAAEKEHAEAQARAKGKQGGTLSAEAFAKMGGNVPDGPIDENIAAGAFGAGKFGGKRGG